MAEDDLQFGKFSLLLGRFVELIAGVGEGNFC